MPSGDDNGSGGGNGVPTPAEQPWPMLSTVARNGVTGTAETAKTTAGAASAGIGNTIHPKLSLSAKRSVGSAAGGAELMTIVDGGAQPSGVPTKGTPMAKVPNAVASGVAAAHPNNSGGSGKHFTLSIRISDAENGTPIMFKQDGNRFATSQRTLKLHSNCKYRVGMQCTPWQDFISLHIGGSDLELVTEGAHCSSAGEYTAMWNTTGIEPSRKGVRQDILFVLSGPGKTLNRKLQTKFYAREHSHAGMGHRVEAICWTCELDPTGQVLVVDEKLR